MMLWSLCFFALLALTGAYRTVCYYTNWAQYRYGKGLFYPENVNPNLCTHLIYAFAKPVGLDISPFEWNDDSTEWSEGMYSRVMKLKVKNPNLQILLAVGGYNMGSQPFIPIVDTAASRTAFASNAVKFLRSRSFDGLDMDWEYPGSRGSTLADKGKLVLLVQEMRRTFEAEAKSTQKPRLLLTGAVPAGKDNIDAGFDLPNLMMYMDFVSIMTYDLHGSWEPYTGINSPLYANTNDVGNNAYLNLHWAAQYYVSLGAPKDKLNIGIALYGRSFTLNNANNHDIGAPASQPGDAGLFTGEKGFLAYYEICDMINSGATVVDVTSQRNRYLYKGTQWVGYDDPKSVTEKACYVKENGFGGAMFWALDLDDFTGQTCGQGTYPLLNTALTELSNPSLANCARPDPGLVVTFQTENPHDRTTPSPTPSISHSGDFDCSNKADDFYPDPKSCNGFYICANKVAYKTNCGTGLLFNQDKKHCEYDYLGVCVDSETTSTPRNVATAPAQATTTQSYTVCVGLPDGAIAHPTQCHKFFLCVNGISQLLECLGSMTFNPVKGQCDFTPCTSTAILG